MLTVQKQVHYRASVHQTFICVRVAGHVTLALKYLKYAPKHSFSSYNYNIAPAATTTTGGIENLVKILD